MKDKKLLLIIYGFIIDRIFPNNKRIKPKKLPDYLDGFKFQKDLQPTKNFPFKVGLYRNNRGYQVVIKIWEGKNKDIHYFDLLHQIEVLRILNRVDRRILKILPEKLKYISMQKLIAGYEKNNSLILITEFIKGVPLSKIKHAGTQWSDYKKCVEYLRFLGKNLTPDEKKVLRTKFIWQYLALYPFLLMVAILDNPKLIFALLNASFIFFRNIPAFLKYHEGTIIHGDLNLGNMYVNGKKIIILDVEQTVYSYPELELVASLSTLGITESMRIKLFNELNKITAGDTGLRKRISALTINTEMHNLTWKAPTNNIIWYTKLLNFGVDLNRK